MGVDKTDSEEQDMLTELMQTSEEIFDGTVLHVFKDQVGLPNGNSAVREVIRHIGAVCIIPVTDDGHVILERQYRYAVGQVITEIPAGKLDYPEEDRLEAARRELKEETGYTADRWQELGIFYPAPAYSDEKITMYLATGLHMGTQHLDADEFLNLFELPLEEAVHQVMEGQITDSKTQIGILKAARIINCEHAEEHSLPGKDTD